MRKIKNKTYNNRLLIFICFAELRTPNVVTKTCAERRTLYLKCYAGHSNSKRNKEAR
jgi:hypothetical protein